MSMENDLSNRNVILSTKVSVRLPEGKSAKFYCRGFDDELHCASTVEIIGYLIGFMECLIGILADFWLGEMVNGNRARQL